MTTEALEALDDTLRFIEIWIKLLDDNYDARRVSYSTAMKDMFTQIPTPMTNHLFQTKIPEIYDRNWWWMVYGKNC